MSEVADLAGLNLGQRNHVGLGPRLSQRVARGRIELRRVIGGVGIGALVLQSRHEIRRTIQGFAQTPPELDPGFDVARGIRAAVDTCGGLLGV